MKIAKFREANQWPFGQFYKSVSKCCWLQSTMVSLVDRHQSETMIYRHTRSSCPLPPVGYCSVNFLRQKAKCAVPHEECRRNAHLPYLGSEPVGGWTTEVCDAWPVRRQTYGYLPSRSASPPFDRYQIILLWWQRHVCANNLPKVVTWKRKAGDRTRDLLSRKSNALATTPPGHIPFTGTCYRPKFHSNF